MYALDAQSADNGAALADAAYPFVPGGLRGDALLAVCFRPLCYPSNQGSVEVSFLPGLPN